MKKYDLHSIMRAAWKFFRKGVSSFALALRLAWANAKTQDAAKATAEITEETHTWAGWKALGYEVIHTVPCRIFSPITTPTRPKQTSFP